MNPPVAEDMSQYVWKAGAVLTGWIQKMPESEYGLFLIMSMQSRPGAYCVDPYGAE